MLGNLGKKKKEETKPLFMTSDSAPWKHVVMTKKHAHRFQGQKSHLKEQAREKWFV